MMQPGEVAWIAREYVRGRRQIEIAHEIGFTTSVQVCLAIREFCDDWSGADVERLRAYGNSRRYFLRKALRNYAAAGEPLCRRPVLPNAADLAQARARYEHAWLLRAEGLTLCEIGDRLDVSATRVKQLLTGFSRRVKQATRRTKFRVIIKVAA